MFYCSISFDSGEVTKECISPICHPVLPEGQGIFFYDTPVFSSPLKKLKCYCCETMVHLCSAKCYTQQTSFLWLICNKWYPLLKNKVIKWKKLILTSPYKKLKYLVFKCIYWIFYFCLIIIHTPDKCYFSPIQLQVAVLKFFRLMMSGLKLKGKDWMSHVTLLFWLISKN